MILNAYFILFYLLFIKKWVSLQGKDNDLEITELSVI